MTRARARLRRPPSHRRLLALVASVEVALNALFFALGVRPDPSTFDLTGSWQVLDRFYLQRDLWRSLYYLQEQPPLYNLLVGFFVKIPPTGVETAMVLTNGAFGLVLVTSAYLLAAELGVPLRLSAALAIVVAASPSVALYEGWIFYTLPTAALLTLACYLAARFCRSGSTGAGIGAFAAVSAVVLANSTFQWPYLVGLAVLCSLALGLRARRVLLIAFLPVIVVAGWYAKDAVVFGTYSTSSLLGMNLAKTTLLTTPLPVLDRLVTEGRLNSIALVPPWQSARAYVPYYVHRSKQKDRILAEFEKRDRVGPNFNNAAVPAISNDYLHADLQLIAARPLGYLSSVWRGIRLWLVPTEQYSWLAGNESKISGYDDLVDRVVFVQPQRWHGSGLTPPAPSYAQISYGAALVDGLALFGLPILAFSRRRDRRGALSLLVVWWAVAYTFVVTSLVEYGENNRFRFDIGPIPLVGAAVVLLALVGALRARRARRAGAVAEVAI